MDKDTLRLAMDAIEELEGALEPVGLRLRRLDLEQSGGYPTVLIGAGKKDGEDIVCNVLPVHMGGLDVMFIQFYLTLTAPAPEERRQALERFVKEANERFMLGSLLVFRGGLQMRYALALDPAVGLEEAHVQTAVAAFLHQGAVYGKLAGAIIDGTMTVEAALEHRE